MPDENNYLHLLSKPTIENVTLMPNRTWDEFHLYNHEELMNIASKLADKFPSQLLFLRRELDPVKKAIDIRSYIPYLALESTVINGNRYTIHFPYHENKPLRIDHTTKVIDADFGSVDFTNIRVFASVCGYDSSSPSIASTNNIAFLLCMNSSSLFVMKYDILTGVEIDRVELVQNPNQPLILPVFTMTTNLDQDGNFPNSYPTSVEPAIYVTYLEAQNLSNLFKISMIASPMTKVDFPAPWHSLNKPCRIYSPDYTNDYLMYSGVSNPIGVDIEIFDLQTETWAQSGLISISGGPSGGIVGKLSKEGHILYDNSLWLFDPVGRSYSLGKSWSSTLTALSYGVANDWLVGDVVNNTNTIITLNESTNPRFEIYPLDPSTWEIDLNKKIHINTIPGKIGTIITAYPVCVQSAGKIIHILTPSGYTLPTNTVEDTVSLNDWKASKEFSYGSIIAPSTLVDPSDPNPHNITIQFPTFRRYPMSAELSNCFDKKDLIVPVANSLELTLLEDDTHPFSGKPVNIDESYSGIVMHPPVTTTP